MELCSHKGKKTREGVCLDCGELPAETAAFIEKMKEDWKKELLKQRESA